MNHHPLVLPVLAQIALTVLVWCWMYLTRLSSMIRNRVAIEDLRTEEGYQRIRDATNPSDNFENLFEVPVLFFVLMLLLIHGGDSDPLYEKGAWAFVAFRAVHSLVHCTVNIITLRFTAYFLSCIALFWMWGKFALAVLG